MTCHLISPELSCSNFKCGKNFFPYIVLFDESINLRLRLFPKPLGRRNSEAKYLSARVHDSVSKYGTYLTFFFHSNFWNLAQTISVEYVHSFGYVAISDSCNTRLKYIFQDVFWMDQNTFPLLHRLYSNTILTCWKCACGCTFLPYENVALILEQWWMRKSQRLSGSLIIQWEV